MNTIEDALCTACAKGGVEYRRVPLDGNWHRSNLTDDQRGRGDASIKIFSDGKGGIVWNHKSGQQETFFINGGSSQSLTPEELKQRTEDKQRREVELIQKREKKAFEAQRIWQGAAAAPADHPYLIKKSVKPYGARVGTWFKKHLNSDNDWKTLSIENSLIIPLFSERGEIRNIQAIFPEESPELQRQKDFLAGAQLNGMFWWLGDKSNDVVCICEGFSTAATLYEHTGYRVYIAFSANNLLRVARSVRKHLPKAKIIVCADNDEKTQGNPGIAYANKAAFAVHGEVVVPPVAGDFNDYAAVMAGGDYER